MRKKILNFYKEKKGVTVLGICFLCFLNFGFSLNFSSDKNYSSIKVSVTQKVFATEGGYEVFEKIPGQKREVKDLLDYLDNVYKFGIAISAILAFVMISIASFVIMVSGAGNASKIGDAKSMVGDAVFGLVLALTAYLFLYVINPDLLSAYKEKQETAGEITYGTEGTASSVSNNVGYGNACPKGNETEKVIDYGESPADEQSFNKNCSNSTNNETDMVQAFEDYGGNLNESGNPGIHGACLLKTIAHIETKCGVTDKKERIVKTKDGTEVKVCGLMQMSEDTALSLLTEEEKKDVKNNYDDNVCNKIVKNDAFAVDLAQRYILKNKGAVSGLKGYNKIAGLMAGYNSGYGCPSGPKKSLCKSSDCPGSTAFECCIDPGKLDESIGYAWSGVGLYKQCTGDGN